MGLRRFLHRRVLRLCAVFAIVFFYTVWAGWLFVLADVISVGGSYPRIDFFAFWAGSSLALQREASLAYDAAAMGQEQHQLPGDDSGYQPWRNPPVFFFFVLPLALLPVAASLVAWVAATGAILLSAVRRISTDRTVLLLTLAFPATFWNLVIGQNGFLTAGLFGWGMVLLRDRPLLAGAVLGLLTYKPQFFPLILPALLAGGQKRALLSAAASAAALAGASLAVFGIDSWEGFVSTAWRSGSSIYSGELPLYKLQSVSAFVLSLGAPTGAAQAAQAGAALGSVGFVVWLWRREAALEYKAAGLAIAALLATPYSYHYDLMLLGLAILWLGLQIHREGWRRWEAEVLMLAWLTPLLPQVAGRFVHVTFAPLVMLLVITVLVRRVRNQRVQTASRERPDSEFDLLPQPVYLSI